MSYNTKINLTNNKVCQNSGDILTLSGNTIISTIGNIKYAGDITFTGDTQIITKKYVDDAIIGEISGITTNLITGATNGLTRIGTNVTLGGALTGNTFINNNSHCLEFYSSDANYYSYATITPTDTTTSLFRFYGNPDGGNRLYTGLIGNDNVQFLHACNLGTDDSCLTIENNQIKFDSRIAGSLKQACFNQFGFIYSGDYSSSFVARSIPDVAYVTGLTSSSGIQTANNGLTKVGTNVVLGGTLTGITNINVNGNGINFDGDGSGNDYFGIGYNINSVGDVGIYSNYIGLYGNVETRIGLNTGSAGGELYFDENINRFQDRKLNGSGLEYYEDYSDNYTARSLVDAAYVTGLTSSSGIQTANNGLTKVGTNVVLGGTLSEDTTVDGAWGLYFGYGATPLKAFNVDSDIRLLGGVQTGLIKLETDIINISGSTGVEISVDNSVDLISLNTSNGLYASYDGNGDIIDLSTNGSASLYIDGGSDTINVSSAAGPEIYIDGANNCLEISGIVKLTTIPNTGSATTDAVLVWNSTDNEIKQVSLSNVGEANNIYAMTVVTGNTTLTTGSTYVQLVNSPTTALTITLPATPINGQVFRIKDAAGTALTYNITIARNGKLIDGATNDGVLNTNSGALELVYNTVLGSWFVFSFVN